MPITFQCPNDACKRRMTVKDELAGRRGVCSSCKTPLIVPATNGIAAPAPALKPAVAAGPTAKAPPPPSVPGPRKPPPVTSQAKDAEAQASASARRPPAADAPSPPKPKPAAKRPAGPETEKAAPPETNGKEERSATDAEAEAAAFLNDEPKKEDVALTSIMFKCEWCDFDIEVALDMAGKRTPCPDCRRITKIPDPTAKKEKKEWHRDAQAPAAPEGAAGTGKDATMVSQEALEEAGAIPDEPLTGREKFIRYAGVACVAGLVAWGVWAIMGWWAGRKERDLFASVVEYVQSPAAAKDVGVEGIAALRIAIGEYDGLTRVEASGDKNRGCAEKAQQEFNQALAQLGDARENSPERDAVLMDLALAFVELGGSGPEVDKELRLKWDKVHKQLNAILSGIHDEQGRLVALRAVTRRLVARDQAQQALDLAAQVFAEAADVNKNEAVATIGLDLFDMGKKDLANAAADLALVAAPVMRQSKQEKPRLSAAVVALGQVTGRLKERQPAPGFAEIEDNIVTEIRGRVEALAHNGYWADARKELARLNGTSQYLLGVAALAGIGPEGKTELTAALKAVKLLPPWMAIGLIDLGVRSGFDLDPLQAAADAIPATRDGDGFDFSLQGRAQLLVFRARLAAAATAVDDGAVESIKANKTLSARLAKLYLARHNTRLDKGFVKKVQGWNEPDRSFGAAGALLALRGGR